MLAILFLCGFLGLITPHWLLAGRTFTQIPFNLHSVAQADYSADPRPSTISGVNLSILADILRDLDPKAQDIEERVMAVLAQIDAPVPVATPSVPGGVVALPNPAVIPSEPAVTIPPVVSTEPSPAPTSMVPTTVIILPPPATAVPSEPEEPEEPPPPPTPPPVPTSTPTDCSNPIPGTGYLTSVSPADGSLDVPVNLNILVQFNQAMLPSSLTYSNYHIILCRAADVTCQPADTVGASMTIADNLFTNDLVTVIPTDPLDNNHTYYLTIGGLVQNVCSWPQIWVHQSSFTTIP